jgi:hypothetical protein
MTVVEDDTGTEAGERRPDASGVQVGNEVIARPTDAQVEFMGCPGDGRGVSKGAEE